MRFKVGDKVRIKSYLVAGKDYGNETFIDKMNQYKGQVGIIKNITINEKGIKYQLLINNNQESFDWFWSDEMLETYSELKEKEIKIFTSNKIITVLLKGEYIRKGISKWNGKDKYDEKIGILIATARALKFDEETVQDFIKAIFKEEDKKENIKKEEIKKEPKLSLVSSNGVEFNKLKPEDFDGFMKEILNDIKAQEMKKIKTNCNKDKGNNIKVDKEIKSNLKTKNPKLIIIKKNVSDDKSFGLMKKEIDKLLEDIRTDFISNLIKELF